MTPAQFEDGLRRHRYVTIGTSNEDVEEIDRGLDVSNGSMCSSVALIREKSILQLLQTEPALKLEDALRHLHRACHRHVRHGNASTLEFKCKEIDIKWSVVRQHDSGIGHEV